MKEDILVKSESNKNSFERSFKTYQFDLPNKKEENML